ncbi:hypothetical protein FNW25_10820 [Flavobacterium franklandianum]|uniref:Uncharacterized protein n=1 Tax=Flavobacterium franklandianum TaxID=2594430 RepID=A0A553CIX7_9FLAO|nr:hypothetical protein [Flavobacterium franklandianum]TRX20452.1 hypothetical protein FNW17_11370 [Flavobacterium franklandianum]TRX24835.1 hypothetical protein FNW25_10820 [Flavobacterium franklandianum]
MAKPVFSKSNYPKDKSRYFWCRKEFTVAHKNAERVALELRKVKYGAHVFVNVKKVGVQNIGFSSIRMYIKYFLKKDTEIIYTIQIYELEFISLSSRASA